MVYFLRSVLGYFFLIFVIRLLGKRQLGEMEPSEFVVSMLIADLAATVMQDEAFPVLAGAIPIAVVLTLELLFSALSYHSVAIRKLFCGKPMILMEDGKILQENLRKTRVTPDELTEHLREKGIVDLSTVKYAILETNGQISALLDPKYQPLTPHDVNIETAPMFLPITIISNGTLLNENLKISGRSESWVHQQLSGRNCKIQQVLLLTVDPSGNVYLALSE